MKTINLVIALVLFIFTIVIGWGAFSHFKYSESNIFRDELSPNPCENNKNDISMDSCYRHSYSNNIISAKDSKKTEFSSEYNSKNGFFECLNGVQSDLNPLISSSSPQEVLVYNEEYSSNSIHTNVNSNKQSKKSNEENSDKDNEIYKQLVGVPDANSDKCILEIQKINEYVTQLFVDVLNICTLNYIAIQYVIENHENQEFELAVKEDEITLLEFKNHYEGLLKNIENLCQNNKDYIEKICFILRDLDSKKKIFEQVLENEKGKLFITKNQYYNDKMLKIFDFIRTELEHLKCNYETSEISEAGSNNDFHTRK